MEIVMPECREESNEAPKGCQSQRNSTQKRRSTKVHLKNNKIKLYKSCKNRKCTYYSKKTTEKKTTTKSCGKRW